MTGTIHNLLIAIDIIVRSAFAVAAYAASLLAFGQLSDAGSFANPLLATAATLFLFLPLPALLSLRRARMATFVLPLLGGGLVLFAVMELAGGDLVRHTPTPFQAALLGAATATAALGLLIAGFLDDVEHVERRVR